MAQLYSRPEGKIAAHFDVRFTRYVDPAGEVVSTPLPPWADDPDVLIPIYRTMLLTRAFDASALQLQRTGRLGTFASPLGQEAIGAGTASAMRPEDVLVPSYREFSAQIWRGVTLAELLLYWGGDERGSDYQGPRDDFPASIPVASHCCHAAGAAYAFKALRQPRVAVCFLGDGATSKGDFYESLNAAGAWKVPLVFIVSNNRWAISVPLHRQTAATTLAQKAVAAGVDCEQVDGNDVIAVRAAAECAIEKARSGQGPHLIEALTYRISDHTTADDASRYRDPAEVDAARAEDPVSRFRAFLSGAALLSDEEHGALTEAVDREVKASVEQYLATGPMPPGAMFDHLFADLPDSMADQMSQAQETGDHD